MSAVDPGPLFPFVVYAYERAGRQYYGVTGPEVCREEGFESREAAEVFAKEQKELLKV